MEWTIRVLIFEILDLENCELKPLSRFAMELELMVKPRTMMPQGDIFIHLCPP